MKCYSNGGRADRDSAQLPYAVPYRCLLYCTLYTAHCTYHHITSVFAVHCLVCALFFYFHFPWHTKGKKKLFFVRTWTSDFWPPGGTFELRINGIWPRIRVPVPVKFWHTCLGQLCFRLTNKNHLTWNSCLWIFVAFCTFVLPSHFAVVRHKKMASTSPFSNEGNSQIWPTECVLINFRCFQNTQRRSEWEEKVIFVSRYRLFNIFKHPILFFHQKMLHILRNLSEFSVVIPRISVFLIKICCLFRISI